MLLHYRLQATKVALRVREINALYSSEESRVKRLEHIQRNTSTAVSPCSLQTIVLQRAGSMEGMSTNFRAFYIGTDLI